MGRILATSALFVLGLFAVAATAQPPVADTKPKQPEKKAEKKAADPLDARIGSALLHDADVQVARAKVQLAEAELTKARQAVAQKVIALSATVEEQRKAVAFAARNVARVMELARSKAVGQDIVDEARAKLEGAEAHLARAETELRLLTGGSHKAAADGWDDLNAIHRNTTWQASCMTCHAAPAGKGAADPAVQRGMAWLAHQQMNGAKPGDPDGNTAFALKAFLAAGLRPEPVKGPMADRIRAALDKPVKLGPKGEKVTFEKALEVFKKEAGFDVSVRTTHEFFEPLTVQSEGEELPVGAWLQLYQDNSGGRVIYVREYGLLLTEPKAAPPDAITVFDFWKQKAEKKAGTGASVTGRYKGTAIKLGLEAEGILAKAAAAMTFTRPEIEFPEFNRKRWDAALAGDHLRVVVTGPKDFDLGWTHPGDLVIDLSKSPESYEVLVASGPPGAFTVYKQQGAEVFRPFTEALRKAGVVK